VETVFLPLRFEDWDQEWEWRTVVVERRQEGNNNVYPYNRAFRDNINDGCWMANV
jgi:hypothetical protein